MVLDHYGVEKSEAMLAKLSGTTRGGGVEAPGLARAARSLGFGAVVKDRSTLADIKKYPGRGVPVIVDWFSGDDGHYSVAVGMDKKKIYLQDPELGRRRSLDIETFKRIWFDFPGNELRTPKDIIIRRLIAIYRKRN